MPKCTVNVNTEEEVNFESFFLRKYLMVFFFLFLIFFSFRELSGTFSQLASMVDRAREKIKSRIDELDEEIVKMKELESKAKLFK